MIQKLYPHHPPALLPLLKLQLPVTLSIYGTIVSNNWPHTPPSDIPTDSATTTRTRHEMVPYAWCTFPPHSLPAPPKPWMVILHLPPPLDSQTRSFCSAETEASLSAKDRLIAEKLVVESVRTFMALFPLTRIMGGSHWMWMDALIRDLGVKGNIKTWIWLSSDTTVKESTSNQSAVEGLVVDVGRPEDAELASCSVTQTEGSNADYWCR